MKFHWCDDKNFCEIVFSDDVGYILETAKIYVGRHAFFVDKLNPNASHEDDDYTVAQSHAKTRDEARRAAERAFLQHFEGFLEVVK